MLEAQVTFSDHILSARLLVCKIININFKKKHWTNLTEYSQTYDIVG